TRGRVAGLWHAAASGGRQPPVAAPRGADAPPSPTHKPLFTPRPGLAFATRQPAEAFRGRYKPFHPGRLLPPPPPPPHSLPAPHARGGVGDEGGGGGRGGVGRTPRRRVLPRRGPAGDAVLGAVGGGAAVVRLAGGVHGLGPDQPRRPTLPQPGRAGRAIPAGD